MTNAILHGNHHCLFVKIPDISLFIKYMTCDSVFEELLGRGGLINGNKISTFVDFLLNKNTRLYSGFLLAKYQNVIQSNCNNYSLANSNTYSSDDKNYGKKKTRLEM